MQFFLSSWSVVLQYFVESTSMSWVAVERLLVIAVPTVASIQPTAEAAQATNESANAKETRYK